MGAKRTLKARLANAAKTYDAWQLVTNTPKLGEICLEIHTGSLSEYPYMYRAKIGDGTSSYNQLPYFGDIVSISGSCQVAQWDTVNEYVKLYTIKQANGTIYLPEDPSMVLRTSGSGLAMSASSDGTTMFIDLKHTGTAPSVTGSVILQDSGSFSAPAAYDEHGHVTKTRTYQLPTYSASIAAISGTLGNVSSSFVSVSSSISGTLASHSSSLATISGTLGNVSSSFVNVSSSISGTLAQQSNSLATMSGTLGSVSSSFNSVSSSVSTSLANLSSSISSISGSVSSSIGALSSSVATTTSNLSSSIATVSGTLSQISSSFVGVSSSISGTLAQQSSSIGQISGTLAAVSGTLASVSGTLATTSGTLATVSGTLSSVSSSYNNVSSSVSTSLANLSSSIGAVSSSVSSSIAGLNSQVGVTSSVNVLTAVTESAGKLTSKQEVELKGLDGITISGSTGKINIKHDPINTGAANVTGSILTDSGSVEGERDLDVITGMSVDAQGHITHIDRDKSSNMIAADIKAPVAVTDSGSVWNYRETGGPNINIGEDVAKIPVLKGKTLVWNQLIPTSSFKNGTYTGWAIYSATVEYVTNHLHITSTGTNSQFACDLNSYIAGHKYYVACNVKTTSDKVAFMSYRSGGTFIPYISLSSSKSHYSVIATPSLDGYCRVYFSVNESGVEYDLYSVYMTDLTKLFGSDEAIAAALGVSIADITSETAVANFEKLFPNSYYPYCEGRLVNLGGYGVKMNQLVQNGNFADGTTGWTENNVTSTVSNNEITITSTAVTWVGLRQNIHPNINKKYYIRADVKSSSGVTLGLQIGNKDKTFVISSTYNKYSAIIIPTSVSDSYENMFVIFQSTEIGQTLTVKNVQVIDLTLMFGAGNEPSLEECEQIFTEDYYEYNAGYDCNILDVVNKKLELLSTDSAPTTGTFPDESDEYTVDMGLPSGLLWARSNIDVTQESGFAASPYQYECTFFSWGNVDGHNPISDSAFDYNWGNVNAQEPWYDGQVYGGTPGNSLIDNIVTHNVSQDAAYRNVGTPWHMPSSTEFQELVNNCDFIDASGNIITGTDKRITINGVVGIYLRSKINGNRLFFSASGYGYGSSWNSRGASGVYWSASFGSARNARYLSFVSGGVNPQNYDGRCNGFAVRPVRSKKQTLDLDWVRNVGVENFNVWDEEWESGYINPSDGQDRPAPSMIRSKNYIPILPLSYYYLHNGSVASSQNTLIFFYDANKNYITYDAGGNKVNQAPENASFMRFFTATTPYNHDICINLSNPALNGEYHPHGEKAKYFPQGLLSAGSVYDEVQEGKLIKRVGAVDMGTLNFASNNHPTYGLIFYVGITDKAALSSVLCSKYSYGNTGGWNTQDKHINTANNNYIYIKDSTYSDAQTFTDSMSGVLLYYELDTPIEIPLDQPHLMTYAVADHGTEQQLPVSAYSPFNAPFVGNFTYYSNFKDAVLDLLGRWGDYSPSNNTIIPTGQSNTVLVPTIDAIVRYVRDIATSPLNYMGTITAVSQLPTEGTKTGDVYILSQDDTSTTPTTPAGTWFIRNKNNDGWDEIRSSIIVTNSTDELTLNINGAATSASVGTVNGTTLDVRIKAIPTGSKTQYGVVQMTGSVAGATDETKVPTAKSVWDVVSPRNVQAIPVSNINGTPTVVYQAISGSTTPSVAPQLIGQFYIKYSSPRKVYVGVGTSSSGDWMVVASE